MGFNIFTFGYKGYQLNIWDIGGQKTLRSYWRNYYEQTDGIIWVIDSADKERLDDCKKELYTILQEEKLASASLLIFANKQDLSSSLSIQSIYDFLELINIENRHCKIVACSAVSGDGLHEGIDWIVQDISSRIFLLD